MEEIMSDALVIIDMQNDYCIGGNMELYGIDVATENTKKILLFYRKTTKPVYHIQHLSIHEGATFFVPNTIGVEINALLNPLGSEKVIKKHFPNSFRETNLLEELQSANIDHLTICGTMSHLCVDATTRAAFDLGFRCTLVTDACATRDLTFEGTKIPANFVHGAFMAALSPVYARLKKTEEIMT
jgi:nicotinamidase-related amidase